MEPQEWTSGLAGWHCYMGQGVLGRLAGVGPAGKEWQEWGPAGKVPPRPSASELCCDLWCGSWSWLGTQVQQGIVLLTSKTFGATDSSHTQEP